MTVLQVAVVFGAGVIAGVVNSVAGGGSLISFPALVWAGRDPLIANATNTVAIVPGTVASAVGFRRDLEGTRQWIIWFIGPSLVGGAVGAELLLHTPSKVFSEIVPYLIFGATILLGAKQPLSRFTNRHSEGKPSTRHWIGSAAFQFVVAVYGGYFGAGIGILMIAALALLGMTDVYKMSGLKNVLAAAINLVATILFIASGAVIWHDVLLMAAGSIVGGYGGAGLARKVGPVVVHRFVIFVGFAMSLSLFLVRHH